MNFSLKQKLYYMAAAVVVSLIALFIEGQLTKAKVERLNGVVLASSQLQTDMLMLRRNEKDFLMRQDLKYLDKFNRNFNKAQANISALIDDISHTSLSIDQAKKLSAPLLKYKDNFNALVSATEKKGLDKDSGH